MYRIGTTLLVGASPDLIELAQLLGRDGERIGLMARNEQHLRQFKERLDTRGVECEAFVADVTESESVLLAFQRFAEWSRRLDRMIYNVGMVSDEHAADVTSSSLHQVMSTNFFGFVNCVQLGIPMFKRTGGGHVLAISSTRALDHDQPVADAASKASLQIYISALRRELSDSAFRISEVFLGQMRSGQGWRDLACEEIVQGLRSAIHEQPQRYMIGETNRE